LENLKSDRMILRPLLSTDAQDLFSYRSEPDIYQFQNWQPKTMADVVNFIETRIAGEPDVPNTWFQLALCTYDPYELIGDCGLHFFEKESNQVEVGITLKREYQGLGYATEALKSVFNFLFGELKKHRIFGSVDPNNRASIRLMERLGMRKEAHFIESLWSHDRWSDDMIYAILSREWKIN
jgi:RimJ/RimL family protein N-acetyltransferase